jgi:hypothetical protein
LENDKDEKISRRGNWQKIGQLQMCLTLLVISALSRRDSGHLGSVGLDSGFQGNETDE